MKKIFLFLSIALIMAFTSCNCDNGTMTTDEMVSAAKENIQKITAEDLYKLMESDEFYTLVDVRSTSEHYHGYIPGAVIINRGSLEFKILKPSFWEDAGLYIPKKDEKLVVYCKKGARSILAAETLQKLGFKKVFFLDGGFKKWELTYPDWVDKNLDALGGGTQTHDMGGGC